jgi:carbon-monoxide dehydrogenase small subunit
MLSIARALYNDKIRRRGGFVSARVHDICVVVNGETIRESVAPRTTLVDFLRETLALTGSHVGCEHGICGACTVRVDGAIVRGCLMLAVQCDGARVDTIEGVSDSGEIADLQAAFAQRNALQCGFCTPGMLLTAQELLAGVRSGVPSRETIRDHISGNYCRCTGYQAIVDAIEAVALQRASSSFRGAGEAREPGVQNQRTGNLDTGSGPSGRPGMTTERPAR